MAAYKTVEIPHLGYTVSQKESLRSSATFMRILTYLKTMSREEKYEKLIGLLGKDPSLAEILDAIYGAMKDDWQVKLRTLVVGNEDGSRIIWHLQVTTDEWYKGAEYDIRSPLSGQSERVYNTLLFLLKESE